MKTLKKIGTVLLVVPVCIILLVGSVLYLLCVPFDYIKFKRSAYHKKLGKKYSLFLTSSSAYKIYEAAHKQGSSLEYQENGEFKYFVKDGKVFLTDWALDSFEYVDGEWFFKLENEGEEEYDEPRRQPIKELLGEEIADLKDEHRSLPTYFLMLYSDITDAERFEEAKSCPYFACFNEIEDFVNR